MAFADFFDEYSRTARLQPALYTLLPLVITTWTWARAMFDVGSALISICVASGLFVVFAHVSRVLGLRRQRRLITKWGGLPTTLLLRHRDTTIDPYTKARYHQTLEQICPRWTAPTKDEEQKNQKDADERYTTAIKWMISNTYDKNRFRILFKENVSYGFRRNLLGLKPFGLTLSIVCVIFNAIALAGYFSWLPNSTSPLAAAASLAFSVLVSALWLLLITERFVRDSAAAYAHQLLNSIDQLHDIRRKTSAREDKYGVCV